MRVCFDLPFEDAELRAALIEAGKGKAGPLRLLCRKEVERFEAVLKRHPDYADGLVKIERLAVEGYLYQKLRGHLDAPNQEGNLPQERQDGET